MAEKFWGKVLGTTSGIAVTVASVPIFWGEVAVKLIKRDEGDIETLKFAAKVSEIAENFGDEHDDVITKEAIKKVRSVAVHFVESYISDKFQFRSDRYRRDRD